MPNNQLPRILDRRPGESHDAWLKRLSNLDPKVIAELAAQAAASGTEIIAKKATAELLRAGIKEAARSTGNQALRAAARSNPLLALASLVVDQGADSARLAAGHIDGEEYGKRSAENVGGAAGAAGGMAAGAAVGSMLLPGIGTVIGGFVGSMLGGTGGRAAASSVVR